ncbi:malate/lactate/ureidoglycolate dehydrogenase [Cupriavidus taiwanensis]|uniref:malate/lactate/ureidoglycolate dehydrogenase n=1 Tax=Cupriavidus taiwanensis TaxID=164546 RepID=UPI000E10E6A6|nr:malate/lactate/ureidoglycolate dehydrogenase [Cupriavidus taiwanensis]SOY72807.1 putative deshydrogenase, putative malate deshydrogenase [Cupriavidus taiwanensis]SOY73065.1 putative deshydrogenase, putative malate deshydrogenase [Cupriavidus taiwanensis]SOY97062.1 putative deshydrogenase, putative malate deshydrogenase [Cupriavidus taiwanensis]SOZ66907.1 putative deshydrogenase, putative malate deshydrogenase [Cupriavidus taiwanensis]SOZ84163.1 putative deshydrogenase, putative malate deshy
MSELRIPTRALHQWVTDLWLAAGSSAQEAQLTADHLVGANLSGHDSHGVGMIPRYVLAWQADELQLNRQVSVLQDGGSLLSLDGNRGMGQAVTAQAMEMAIARAREHGVCVMGLRQSHHLGRVGHWAEQATAAGMISIHFVNVLSKPIVAPHGGYDARYGTNPFTIGVPMAGEPPLVLDFATSAIALGKVRVAHNKGAPVGAGCLLDAQGQPTTDAAVMYPSAGSPQGALRPFGEHKGHGLAMMCELLGAAVTGGHTIRPDTLRHEHAVWNNMLAIVFDPARLGASTSFGHEVAAFAEWMKSARLQPGQSGIQLPGEPERAWRAARAQRIPIDAGTLAQLDDAAARVAAARAGGHPGPGPLSALACD